MISLLLMKQHIVMLNDLILRYPNSTMFHLLDNGIPIFMGRNQIEECAFAEQLYQRSVRCWEDQIIDKINTNEEDIFDFSKNMIDIGAGIGEYCWGLPFNHAYAFEPNRKDAALLAINAFVRDRSYNVDIITKGCSDHNFEIDYNGWSVEATERTRQDAIPVQTEFIRLDNMNLKNIGFIKIDIEGHELAALTGAVNTIKENGYPPILIEIWPEDASYWYDETINPDGIEKRDRLIDLLENEFGYTILWNWGDWETHLCVHP